jgi:hypothetical protein
LLCLQRAGCCRSIPGSRLPGPSSCAPRHLRALIPFLPRDTECLGLATPTGAGDKCQLTSFTKEVGVAGLAPPACCPVPIHAAGSPRPPRGGDRWFAGLSRGLWPGGFRGEPGRERASAASSAGRGRRCQPGTPPERVGVSSPRSLPYPRGVLRWNFAAPPGPGSLGDKGQQLLAGEGRWGLALPVSRRCSLLQPFHYPDAKFANAVGTTGQKALGTGLALA